MSEPLSSKQKCYVIPVGPEHHIEELLCKLLRSHHYTYWVADLPVERDGPIQRLSVEDHSDST